MNKTLWLKRSFALLLILVFALGMGVHPGSDIQAEEEEEIVLRFATWQSNFREEEQAAADAYQELHPNVTVEFEFYGDQSNEEYLKKVDLMVMGDEPLDIGGASGTPQMAVRAHSGTYLPLEPFFEARGENIDDIYNGTVPVDGVHYSIPAEWKTWVVLINETMLAEAGLEVPDLDWTWDDYRDYAIAMTSGEGANKKYGSYFHTWNRYNQFASRSVRLDNPIFNVEDGSPSFDQPYWADWLEFRYNLEQVDGASTPFEDVKAMNMNYRNEFFNGNAAMLPTGTWMLTELEDQEKFPHDFSTAVVPVPNWEDGGVAGRTFTEAHLYTIMRTSQNPEAAFDFLRWYTTDGMRVRNVAISLEKDLNRYEAISEILGDTEYINMEVLEKTLNNPAWEDNVDTIVPSYANQIDQVSVEETDLYLLGSQDLETTINNMMERAQAIIDENQ